MRRRIAQWLRSLAQRIDPQVTVRPINVFQYFGEPSTTASTADVTKLRYSVEGGSRG